MRKRRLPVLLAAAIALAAAATPAFAGGSGGSVSVSTSSPAQGTRQLEVLDLAGNPLSSLSLTPAVPSAFRVAVVDSALNDLTQPFSVSAVMNNLYAEKSGPTYDYSQTAGTFIPSSDVTLAFPASNPLSAFGVGLTDTPAVSLSGTIPDCSSLGATITDLVDAVNLCAVGGPLASPLTVPSLTVPSTLTSTVSGIANLADLPFTLTESGGAFTNANYTDGIGAGDTSAAAVASRANPAPGINNGTGTPLTLLSGDPVSSLTGLLSQLNLPTNLPLVSQTGSGALTSLAGLESALSTSGNAALSTLVTDLAPLTAADQVSILNQLLGTLTSSLSTLSDESGTYNSFPSLTVTPPASAPNAPNPGTYSGTLTITMVQQ